MDHIPDRPSWDCRACTRDWPCDPAREHLAAELPPVQLGVYAAVTLGEAVQDMPATPPAELYDRFIGWTRPAAGR